MYHGTNPSAIRSEKLFTSAMFKLLEEKPYHKISVRDICQYADLSRQTFYNFFTDKDDLLHSYFRRLFTSSPYDDFMAGNEFCMENLLNCFSHFMEQQRNVMKLMVHNHLEQIISDEITRFLSNLAVLAVSDKEKSTQYSIAFLSGALSQIMLCWLKDQDPISRQEMADLIGKLLSGKYYQIHF